jgi:O-acetyl-ADP-ribose deacetylase (regulator of RNase III)
MIDIIIVEGDITKQAVEAIVNPANSDLTMGGGVALAIKRAGGSEIEAEAMKLAPCPVGQAVLTTAGRLLCKKVIHAPTMTRPIDKITAKEVRKATVAALRVAEQSKMSVVAFPGLGTGVGGVPKKDAAKAMVEEIKKFTPQHLKRVVLVAHDAALKKAFLEAL